MMNQAILAVFGLPGGWEWIVIALVALLIFGRRLPDVARSVGKSIVEFKKGIKDVKNDVEVRSSIDASSTPKIEQKPEPQAPVASDKPASSTTEQNQASSAPSES
jgi:sec-independent protein translocase protein TatA